MIKKILPISLIFFFLSFPKVSANDCTKYVNVSGKSPNYSTIQQAFDNIQAGDTLCIGPGTYNESAWLNGSSRCSNNSYITITSYNQNNKAILSGGGSSDKEGRLSVSNCGYIKINNLQFKNFYTGGIHIFANDSDKTYKNIYIENNFFQNQGPVAERYWPTTLLIKGGYNKNGDTSKLEQVFIRSNKFFNVMPGAANPSGGMYNEIIALEGNVSKSLVEGNEIIDSYYIAITAKGSSRYIFGNWRTENIVFRNNKVINIKKPAQSSGNGLYVDGGSYILLENNYVKPGGTAVNIGNEPFGSLDKFEGYIFRGNVVDKQDSNPPQGVANSDPMFLGESYCGWVDPPDTLDKAAITHNVINAATNYKVPLMFSLTTNLSLKNNIYNSQESGNIYNATEHATTTQGWESNGNLLCTNGQSNFKWGTNGACNSAYPYKSLEAFQSATNQDKDSIKACPTYEANSYTLTSNSAGYEKAIALTTATQAGTNTNIIKVKDAKYFYDGWGIQGEVGDRIKVGGVETRVTKVDYSTNTLTVSPSISFTNNSPVNYYYEGEAPSMGLLPDSFYSNDNTQPTVEPTPTSTPTDEPSAKFDIDKNGSINFLDVIEMLKYLFR